MIELGELRKGYEIGKLGSSSKFVWHACEDCGKERWIELRKGNKPRNTRCQVCAI